MARQARTRWPDSGWRAGSFAGARRWRAAVIARRRQARAAARRAAAPPGRRAARQPARCAGGAAALRDAAARSTRSIGSSAQARARSCAVPRLSAIEVRAAPAASVRASRGVIQPVDARLRPEVRDPASASRRRTGPPCRRSRPDRRGRTCQTGEDARAGARRSPRGSATSSRRMPTGTRQEQRPEGAAADVAARRPRPGCSEPRTDGAPHSASGVERASTAPPRQPPPVGRRPILARRLDDAGRDQIP